MGMEIGGASEYNSEINVTPMVDVMLVLLDHLHDRHTAAPARRFGQSSQGYDESG